MELFLDERPLEITESDDSALRDILERVSDQLKDQGRVICEVMVDGHYEGDWERDPFGERRIAEVESMRLKSEEPRKLAVRTLYDIVAYMPKVKDALINVSASLQARQEEEALRLLSQVTETWVELNQGYSRATQVIGISPSEVVIQSSTDQESQTAEDVQNEALDLLNQAADFLDERRYLELSDVLEYELAPLIPVIEESMYLLIREAEKKPH